MKLTTEITVRIERTDGSASVVTETETESVGDNPRFEKTEAQRLIGVVTDTVLDKIQGAPVDVLESPGHTPPPGPDAVQNILGLVREEFPVEIPSIEQIRVWPRKMRREVCDWAVAVHLSASDNDHIEIPPLPDALNLGPTYVHIADWTDAMASSGLTICGVHEYGPDGEHPCGPHGRYARVVESP